AVAAVGVRAVPKQGRGGGTATNDGDSSEHRQLGLVGGPGGSELDGSEAEVAGEGPLLHARRPSCSRRNLFVRMVPAQFATVDVQRERHIVPGEIAATVHVILVAREPGPVSRAEPVATQRAQVA